MLMINILRFHNPSISEPCSEAGSGRLRGPHLMYITTTLITKPHPEIFIKATSETGFLRENCFVIEDSTNGIKAAKAAGLFCVGFDSPHSKNQDYKEADLTINSFKEIEFNKIKTLF